MKKLSIIIPVYNVEKYLDKCLSSVIVNDKYDYEIIIVNDGSTDSSQCIVEKYIAQYPKLITLINKQNGGLGSARNAGLSICTGEFVVFFDSDDYLPQNAVQKIFEFLNEDFDILFYDATPVNELGQSLGYIYGASSNESFSLNKNPSILFHQPSVWNKIYRTSLFKDNNITFPDKAWFEDLRTIPKLYIHAKKMIYKNVSLYNYLQRTGSITNSNNENRNLEIIDAIDDILNYYKKKNVYDLLFSELEYMTFFNELLTSIDRVNLINYKSEIQDTLYNDVKSRFPLFYKNKYFKEMSIKYKFIFLLIKHRQFHMLNILLRFNNYIKHKNNSI